MWHKMGPGRLELPTSRLSSACSNQLSYGPSCDRRTKNRHALRSAFLRFLSENRSRARRENEPPLIGLKQRPGLKREKRRTGGAGGTQKFETLIVSCADVLGGRRSGWDGVRLEPGSLCNALGNALAEPPADKPEQESGKKPQLPGSVGGSVGEVQEAKSSEKAGKG